MEDIKRNGVLTGIGKPEKLKNRPEYSRRTDDCNRLVYDIDELGNSDMLPPLKKWGLLAVRRKAHSKKGLSETRQLR